MIAYYVIILEAAAFVPAVFIVTFESLGMSNYSIFNPNYDTWIVGAQAHYYGDLIDTFPKNEDNQFY